MSSRNLLAHAPKALHDEVKPATRESNRLLVRNHILPFFGEMRVADITRAHVRRWFDGLSERPGSAWSRCQARIA